MPKTVLVVDDSSTIRKAVRNALIGEDWSVSDASTMSEAIDIIRNRTPDVVLCDANLGDGEDHEACETIRAQSEASGLPVVLMGPKASDPAIAEAPSVLVKPFASDELLETVNAALEQCIGLDLENVQAASDEPLEPRDLAPAVGTVPSMGDGERDDVEIEEVEVIDLSEDDAFGDLELLEDLEPVETEPAPEGLDISSGRDVRLDTPAEEPMEVAAIEGEPDAARPPEHETAVTSSAAPEDDLFSGFALDLSAEEAAELSASLEETEKPISESVEPSAEVSPPAKEEEVERILESFGPETPAGPDPEASAAETSAAFFEMSEPEREDTEEPFEVVEEEVALGAIFESPFEGEEVSSVDAAAAPTGQDPLGRETFDPQDESSFGTPVVEPQGVAVSEVQASAEMPETEWTLGETEAKEPAQEVFGESEPVGVEEPFEGAPSGEDWGPSSRAGETEEAPLDLDEEPSEEPSADEFATGPFGADVETQTEAFAEDVESQPAAHEAHEAEFVSSGAALVGMAAAQDFTERVEELARAPGGGEPTQEVPAPDATWAHPEPTPAPGPGWDEGVAESEPLALDVSATAERAVRAALESALSAEKLAPVVEAVVEKVVWEVVPQLAERLIEEAIDKMRAQPPPA